MTIAKPPHTESDFIDKDASFPPSTIEGGSMQKLANSRLGRLATTVSLLVSGCFGGSQQAQKNPAGTPEHTQQHTDGVGHETGPVDSPIHIQDTPREFKDCVEATIEKFPVHVRWETDPNQPKIIGVFHIAIDTAAMGNAIDKDKEQKIVSQATRELATEVRRITKAETGATHVSTTYKNFPVSSEKLIIIAEPGEETIE